MIKTSRLQVFNIPLGGLDMHLAAWYLSWLCPGILVSTCDPPDGMPPRLKEMDGYFKAGTLMCATASQYGLWLG